MRALFLCLILTFVAGCGISTPSPDITAPSYGPKSSSSSSPANVVDFVGEQLAAAKFEAQNHTPTTMWAKGGTVVTVLPEGEFGVKVIARFFRQDGTVDCEVPVPKLAFATGIELMEKATSAAELKTKYSFCTDVK